MNRIIKISMVWFFIFLALVPSIAFAQLNQSVWNEQNKYRNAFVGGSGYATANSGSAAQFVAAVIKVFIGLLGIIFVVLIITAGYNWMTASGDEAKIKKARDIMTRAVVGLVIIVSAYAITYFVFEKLDSVSTGTGGAVGGSVTGE